MEPRKSRATTNPIKERQTRMAMTATLVPSSETVLPGIKTIGASKTIPAMAKADAISNENFFPA